MARVKSAAIWTGVVSIGLGFAIGKAIGDQVSITPDRDGTLYSASGGTIAGGASPVLFTGRSGNPGAPLRRTILHFPLTSIPSGSTITNAELKLYCVQTRWSASDVTVHRVTSNWGEGASYGGGGGDASQNNDVTWVHSFYPNTTWTNLGGDFVSAPSTTTTVAGLGATYTWTGPGLVADVQSWLGTPANNFGWILKGTEGASRSAREWASREWSDVSQKPTLVVTFTPPAPCVADMGVQGGIPGHDGILDNNDFVVFINSFFAVEARADVGIQGGIPGSDGIFDNNDFVAFINLFFAGC